MKFKNKIYKIGIVSTVLIFLSSACSMQLMAQGERRMIIERMEAQRVAHITNVLQLSSKEAELFWPLYNEFKEKERSIRQGMNQMVRDKQSIESMSKEEAIQLINRSFLSEEQQLANKKKYFQKMMEVIPPQKVALIPAAEQSFREQVVRRFSEGPGAGRGRRPISAPLPKGRE